MKTHRVSSFSIIELMTVIFIILVLFSISIPQINHIYRSSREVVCGNNLKQLGSLFQLYANDHDGFLPGPSSDDAPFKKSNYYAANTKLYANWNGHLIPYIDDSIVDFHRRAGLHKDGQVYQPGGVKPTSDAMEQGYQIVEESYEIGGYGNLRIFICPEAAKTGDIYTAQEYQDFFLPRVMGITHHSKLKDKGKWCDLGTPASYLANGVFFGETHDYGEFEIRVSEIKNLDKKVLLIEGGQPIEGYRTGGNYYFGGDMGYQEYLSNSGVKNSAFDTDKHILSFFHSKNVIKEAWISESFGDGHSGGATFYDHMVEAFNKACLPDAYITYDNVGRIAPGRRLVSTTGPIDKLLEQPNVKKFLDENPHIVFKSSVYTNSGTYKKVPYTHGEMNVLKGDGSVQRIHQSELYNRGRELAAKD